MSRIGAALVSPRAAMAAVDSAGTDRVGRSPGDAALLVALSFAVLHTRELVSGLWLIVGGDAWFGFQMIAGGLMRVAAAPIVFAFVGGAVLTLLAGRRRSLGADFDLACVALVPLIVVEVAATLVVWASGVAPPQWGVYAATAIGYGWGAVVLWFGVVHARGRAASRGRRVAVDASALWGGATALALFAAMAAVNGTWIASNWSRLGPIAKGEPAPAFSLPRITADGELARERVTVEQLAGRVVVLDFWATWCKPCRDVMPALDRIHLRYREQGLTVLSINTEGPDQVAAARAMLDQLAPSLELVSDDGTVSDMYRVSTIPHMVVVDRRGLVQLVHRGVPGGGTRALERDLSSVLTRLLEAGP